eukprot:scaffold5819_cov148-Skeletonema_menzelii.AAC.1
MSAKDYSDECSAADIMCSAHPAASPKIAANLGFADAIKTLEQCYKDGLLVSKDDFVAALRAHKLPSMQQKAHE